MQYARFRITKFKDSQEAGNDRVKMFVRPPMTRPHLAVHPMVTHSITQAILALTTDLSLGKALHLHHRRVCLRRSTTRTTKDSTKQTYLHRVTVNHLHRASVHLHHPIHPNLHIRRDTDKTKAIYILRLKLQTHHITQHTNNSICLRLARATKAGKAHTLTPTMERRDSPLTMPIRHRCPLVLIVKIPRA